MEVFRSVKKIKNFFDTETEIVYIVENKKWSIYWDGKYIMENLKKAKGKIETDFTGYKNKIIHLGSLNLFPEKENFPDISNKIILTVFHLPPKSEQLEKVMENLDKISCVHVSCEITKRNLIKNGIPKEKITVIPLGVDLNKFRLLKKERIEKIKKKLNLPSDRIIIGSFQKDGNGWRDGLEPKLIKGPDVLCDALEKISARFKIFVLLTGPAREYVKRRLKSAGIPFVHNYLTDYRDIVDYYNVLDLYIIASRVEGGPKAILESMACGIPVISTKVGMAPEVIINGYNGFLSEVGNADNLYYNASAIIGNFGLRRKLIRNGLTSIRKFHWEKISDLYYEKIYSKFI